MTTGAGDAVIAVLDSGVDASHPDLPRLVPGYDVVNHDADPADDLGHGTEVAGAIGARLGNGLGGSGVCPVCSIMPVKVIDGVSGVASDADIVAGIVWATDHGADVINLSLAGPEYSRALQDGVGYATSRGVVVVAAGGERRHGDEAVPGCARRRCRRRRERRPRPPLRLLEPRRTPRPRRPGMRVHHPRGGAYGEACGTSLAAPIVAGIAGLVRSSRPELTGEQVARSSSRARGAGSARGGLVDARRALSSPALVPANTAIPRIAGTVAVGGTLTATPGKLDGRSERVRVHLGALRRRPMHGGRGALADTYELTSADAGSRLRVVVTATNAGDPRARRRPLRPSSAACRRRSPSPAPPGSGGSSSHAGAARLPRRCPLPVAGVLDLDALLERARRDGRGARRLAAQLGKRLRVRTRRRRRRTGRRRASCRQPPPSSGDRLAAAELPRRETGHFLVSTPPADTVAVVLPPLTILICEDEEPLRELVRAALGDDYSFHEAVDGRESLELARSLSPISWCWT